MGKRIGIAMGGNQPMGAGPPWEPAGFVLLGASELPLRQGFGLWPKHLYAPKGAAGFARGRCRPALFPFLLQTVRCHYG